MNFADGAVIVVFAILGYLIVASVLNWLEERKNPPDHSSGRARSNHFAGSAGEGAASPDTSAPRPWHAILEVAEDATLAQIRTAYQLKTAQYHPDKVASMAGEIRALAEMRSKEINAAYYEAARLRSP